MDQIIAKDVPMTSGAGEQLPEEILEIIRLQNTPRFLDALASQALKPTLTLGLYTRYPGLFADTSSRWITSTSSEAKPVDVVAAFARIIPLSPHLALYLHRYLSELNHIPSTSSQIPWLNGILTGLRMEEEDVLSLQRSLLAAWRLLNFDRSRFSTMISNAAIQQLFHHEHASIRYLSVRIVCQLRSASDAKLEAMLEEHLGKNEAIHGDFDGETIDYGFLSIFEQRRLQETHTSRRLRNDVSEFDEVNINNLSPLVVRYGSVLLPRLNGSPHRSSMLIPTPTTTKNLEALGSGLLTPDPILLHGPAGSGKTSLVHDLSLELGVDTTLVTLHLTEQTDAKMLIGVYATGATPGSFAWRAGVLTTAVREGRWVLIEDLDRAPNEVISVLLPLIGRGELSIPSQGETIKASPNFRLFATIRTTPNTHGVEIAPAMHMLGARFWQRVPVQMPSDYELRQVIEGKHPKLRDHLASIMGVYHRIYSLSQKATFTSKNRSSLSRPISPRDLLKWCRRLERLLVAAGSNLGNEPITESTKYEMFMEAADCFAGSLQTEDARRTLLSSIAEEMYIDPQRMEHFLLVRIPRYVEDETSLRIGRVQISRRRPNRVTKSTRKSRPFANTKHAKRILERVGVAIRMAEPVLLVGETGIGKTTVVQQLANSLGVKLSAINLSQQSEVGDLLGGYKPVNVRSLVMPLKEEFDELFAATGISVSKNQKYVDQLTKCIAKGQWSKVSRLWREAPKMFEKIFLELSQKGKTNGHAVTEQPNKKRKVMSRLESLEQLRPRWTRFSSSLDQFDAQLSGGSKGFAFTFVEGNIIKAVRNGEWVLLDEINLASPDTLESIADLLHNGTGNPPSIILSETGEIEKIEAHPDFRIFGAMNPATDVGKKDLPRGIRSRFTEIFVESPDRDLDDLLEVIKAYLKGTSSNDERAARDVARLYMNTKRLAEEKQLVDGANQVPHFSLRTLTRVLSYVTEIAPFYGLRRALYEGFAMGFLTLLNRESENLLIPLINHHLLDGHGNSQALLAQTPRYPDDGKRYKRLTNKKKDRQYWILQGSELPQEQPLYIITPFVERNMLNLVRATSTRQFPILIQGPTSSGKTSMIEYLAKFSGNKFVRINNHEHTDLQEYLGTYVSDTNGQLHFQEGLLVQALRQGHWIVLDELNLAPTDVLEALNRLLDDNRELLIPETQETVRPHEKFLLFATQNPPGLYAGRKTLSRAFRNRFLELHFDDIPEDELDFILEKRSQKVAPSDCRRIVAVYKELSRLRQSNRLFEQKHSFATLRDLFRWALRDADNREQLAANGYMLLAERVRNTEEKAAVKEAIESVMKVKIDPTLLYDPELSPEIKAYNASAKHQGVVWTAAMRRLYILVAHALRNNEPVLLVGETGCGKTTVCQMLAEAFGKNLHIVNAHQNTETGDIIGAQRPVRNRAAVAELLQQDLVQVFQGLGLALPNGRELDDLLSSYQELSTSDIAKVPEQLRMQISTNQVRMKALFEWADGSLIRAMRDGQVFLLDEISLADDSVLERLNSVLEPQRTLLLAEKGVENSFVRAAEGFQFLATMNPGGDYGKRELSPALRNRFTEIWVPSLSEYEDIHQIVEAKLKPQMRHFSEAIARFAEWYGKIYRSTAITAISVRDVLAWVNFINLCDSSNPHFAVLHGAAMVYIDTIGANPAALLAIDPENIRAQRAACLQQLTSLLGADATLIYEDKAQLHSSDAYLAIGEFSIAKQPGSAHDPGFALHAPTTKLNAMRVLRALQIQKPILLEGNPGVGKTTLISALAHASGRPLTRINLSEQTDLMDLFGSDIPVEGSEAGHFAWRDAPFLQAMQKGEWVLLDEMNLASQSILEGLNACLDHRGEVYISELDQTFKRHPNFFVFAAQNPHHQGGGRKGLPSSFVNRFTVVYADVFSNDDLELICKHNYPALADNVVSPIIDFVSKLEHAMVFERRFGSQGSPWEFNLRDILRWLQLLSSKAPLLEGTVPEDFLNLIFRQRFRTARDRIEVEKLFVQVFGSKVPTRHLFHDLNAAAYQVGIAYMARHKLMRRSSFPNIDFKDKLAEIESIMICIQQNVPCILVGSSGSGKSAVLQRIAAASGRSLVTLPLNADVDTMDLVGGFEQVNPQRAANAFLGRLLEYLNSLILATMPAQIPSEAFAAMELLENANIGLPTRFEVLAHHLHALATASSRSQLAQYATQYESFASKSMALENARFEWVDGILIKALEQGKWLVLDNANLCSASVLDRLNSLLEPNGSLSINEHCGLDGKPRVVKPHPDFRIFLTMDPRYGELSRAMRNRAIEIYLDPTPVDRRPVCANTLTIPQPEASLQRYQRLTEIVESEQHNSTIARLLTAVGLDHLSWADLSKLPRYAQTMKQRLQGSSNFLEHFSGLCEDYVNINEADKHARYREAVGALLLRVSKELNVSSGFEDAQTIHPLQNSPLVHLIQQCCDHGQVIWLGALFELKIDIAAALRALQGQRAFIESLKPSRMNRLQRSLVAARVPSVAKDSTSRVATFLEDVLRILDDYLQGHIMADQQWKLQKKGIGFILQYWWDTYIAATAPDFQEAMFQAHLVIGSNAVQIMSSNIESSDFGEAIFSPFNESLQGNFEAGFMLTTGLHMEALWKQLRPRSISSLGQLQTLERMEQLAARFDSLRWKASISITELGNTMRSLVEAYHLLSSNDIDGTALIKTLGTELDKVQTSIGQDENAAPPYFAYQFEALRHVKALEALCSGTSDANSVLDVDIVVLADFPTASEMLFSRATQTSRALQGIDYIFGPSDNLQIREHDLSCEILQRLDNINKVELGSLRLLETELPVFGQKLASSSDVLCRDQLGDLNQVLLQLVEIVVAANGIEIQSEHQNNVQEMLASTDFDSIDPGGFAQHVNKVPGSQASPSSVPDFMHVNAAVAISRIQPERQMQFSAMAWVYFALTSIRLYVPDRVFDPEIRQRLERRRHEEVLRKLRDKLEALQIFERLFSGQESNLRCQLLEEEIEDMGEPPEILEKIYRPTVSELDQLQGEFNSLLKVTIGANIIEKLIKAFSGVEQHSLEEVKLVFSNIGQIIRRLSDRFRAYSDLATPAISLLRCLQTGLLIFLKSSEQDASNGSTKAALMRMTPFLGGINEGFKEDIVTSQPFESLSSLATTAAVEDIDSFDPSLRQIMFRCFHSRFEQWVKRLESDRQDAESTTGLYRFRGTAEDEEEDDQQDFEELFPTYDSENSHGSVPTSSRSARDNAIEIAQVHADILLRLVTPVQGITKQIRLISRQLGQLQGAAQENATKAILPGALLILQDEVDSLATTSPQSDSYNFYVGPNLPETRKFVTLVHQIQARFRELQAVDEIAHMQPLADVLSSCQEVLQLRHTEPLAKLITKVEKIHGFMHEWQFGGWASRANSCQSLYDGITSLIVSWRRLELSTWEKLFDTEVRHCEDDTKSWWFIAYQVIIAIPMSMDQSEAELREYAVKLLQDLAIYFSSAIMGQFEQRLQLLRQLQKHLKLLILDYPLMNIIHDALTNFLAFYSRYKQLTTEHLKKGRASLEKAMRDILLWASWKDTNINALRESAKRSHHKLFKLVRKFRALLGQPMDAILKQGLPDSTSEQGYDSEQVKPLQIALSDVTTPEAVCRSLLTRWSQKPQRFRDPSQTVEIMAKTGRIPDSAIQGSVYLTSFLTNLLTASDSLRKATPSLLTNENKDTVKHLKNRKRKLFADVLKELRHWGIKYNLGEQAVATQSSLSMILASTKPLSSFSTSSFDPEGCEYYFHKAIDLVLEARKAPRQHSEDLSGAEVSRSNGYLEGLLQVTLKQRNVLATISGEAMRMSNDLVLVKALWAPESYNINLAGSRGSYHKALLWLPNIISVGIDLIDVHARLGKIEVRDTQDNLIIWRDQFNGLLEQWKILPSLPEKITSSSQRDLEMTIDKAVSQLNLDVTTLCEQRPDLDFILDQIRPWTIIKADEVSVSSYSSTVSALDQNISTITDMILTAVQNYQTTVKDLPTSTEDTNWLKKSDDIISKAFTSLRCDTITQQIQESFDVLSGLDLSDSSIVQVAGARYAVALPIFEQYHAILQQTITRYSNLHRAICKTTYVLAKSFTQIATQGFCTPPEKPDPQDAKNEKLESGTGLGDGEGAKDISKDIEDDEDLDELAQEPNMSGEAEIDDEKDAVDMADGEMEGEMGDAGEQGEDENGSDGESRSGDEMDEEAGNVDDLDPTAVDEKKWDGDGEEADKDQEGDDQKGAKSKSEQVASKEGDDSREEIGEDEEEEEGFGAEQEEVVGQNDVEKHDPHAQEGEALDLPDDMQLDGDNEEEMKESDDDGRDDLSDMDEEANDGDEVANDGKEESDANGADAQEDQDMGSELDVIDLDKPEENGGQRTEDAGEKPDEPSDQEQLGEQEGLLRDRDDDAVANNEHAIPSDMQGVGEDQAMAKDNDQVDSANKAQREDGSKGGEASEQQETTANDGERGRQADGEAPLDASDETQDSSAAQPFKRLGDALERWHRQQKQIREPLAPKEKGPEQDLKMGEEPEFQHLQDENAEADTQALGTATEDQAHALDESMAIDNETKELPEIFQPDETEQEQIEQDDPMDLEDTKPNEAERQSEAYEGRAGAMIKQGKQEHSLDLGNSPDQPPQDSDEDVSEVDIQLTHTHLNPSTNVDLQSTTAAREQWTYYESLTRDLSLSLTEQLRLILSPTQATKMRGDFRTGKRLNIKRIIPYIASQYKRDKIWMRRSVPSKRTYQIMLAVDDSKSMGESGSGGLAFETLVMVSRTLSMLEVGEISVLAFGETVKVAHGFEESFAGDAGVKILRSFAFQQNRTDITRLVRESIELFRTARQRNSASAADLWQVELIISDGVCDSSEHDAIRRLLREALEERMMFVFVVVDDLRGKKESIADLKEAKFVKNEGTGTSEVKIVHYFDGFPFQNFLVVSDVKELPGVLITVLRTWFSEVAAL